MLADVENGVYVSGVEVPDGHGNELVGEVEIADHVGGRRWTDLGGGIYI